MNSPIDLPIHHPKKVAGIIIALTFLAIGVLVKPGLEVDPNPFPLDPSHPSMEAYRQLKEDFTGTLETALIHIRHDTSVFNSETLERIAQLTEDLEAVSLEGPEDNAVLAAFLPGLMGEPHELLSQITAEPISIDSIDAIYELQELLEDAPNIPKGLEKALDVVLLKLEPVKEVTSLANVDNIIGVNDDLIVEPVYGDRELTAGELERIRDDVMSNALFQDILISRDERSTVIAVETYIPETEARVMFMLYERMLEILAQHPGPETTHVGGVPVVTAMVDWVIDKDSSTFFPVVMTIVMLILLITFRMISGVAIPLLVVIVSVVWTLAIMAISGVAMNVLTTTLPVFLITIGVADGIHLISEYRDHLRKGGTRQEAAKETMNHMGMPVIMTSITTAIGFAALAYTDVKMVKEFGIFVAIGVLVAMVISLTLIPAILAMGKKNRFAQNNTANTGKKDSAIGGAVAQIEKVALGFLMWISVTSVQRHRLILAVSAVVIAVSLYGMSRVEVRNDFLSYFDDSMPHVQAAYALHNNMAGGNVVSILIDAPAGQEEAFKNPENLAIVAALQAYLEKSLPFVGHSTSLADLVKRINLALHNNDPAYDRLPLTEETLVDDDGTQTVVTGRQMVSQYLLLYENGGGDVLSDVTDSTYSTLNVSLNLKTDDSLEIQALLDHARSFAEKNFPEGMEIRFAGSAELSVATNNEVVQGQIVSFSLSLSIILLVLLAVFRSMSKGILAVVPLLFTVILNFGMMGFVGLSLNLGTAIVSSIVIGIGVDYAIHYISRLQMELDKGADLQTAFSATMAASGKAITSNAVTVAFGFLALMLSDFVPLRQTGLLVFSTLIFSAIATLVLLPAATAFLQPKFVREASAHGATGRLAGEAGSAD